MCGIAGVIEAGASGPEHGSALAVVEAMVRALHHRGPDGAGVVPCPRAGAVLGSTRLALLDDAGGSQPWRFDPGDDASPVLAFNGELYNHPELAAALTRAGSPAPRSSCDTETLARGWRALGSSLWAHLDGMFAAAIVDGDELVLARDPHGQKPVFLWREPEGRALVFASELGALLAEPRVRRRLDPAVLVELGAIGFPLGDDALLAGVVSLPPGHELRVRVGEDGRLRETLFDFRGDFRGQAGLRAEPSLPDPRAAAARVDDPVDALVASLPGVVASHARADHPVGLFLSGGLDSGLLAALLVEHAQGPVHTFTLADDPEHPDLEAARALAAKLGTVHHERIVSADEVEAAWPLAVAIQGLPAAPTVAELGGAWARQWVKAALVGDGADELFAGYRYHQVPHRTIGSMAAGYNRMVRQGAVPKGAGDRLRAQFQAFKDAEAEGPLGTPTALMRLFAEDRLVVNHLRRWDHGALAHGLEVRLPYLARPITAVAERLSWSALVRDAQGRPIPGKAPLRAAARRLLPESLARDLTERAKIAAPSALAKVRAELNARCRAWMPAGHRERHPLAACALDEVSLVSIDLFAALYLLDASELGAPADALPVARARELSVAQLYTRHGEALDAYWRSLELASPQPSPKTAVKPQAQSKPANLSALLHDRWTRGADRYADAALELETYTASNALLAELADLRPGMRVVDLACGTGATSRAAFERQPELAQVYAVDWSAQMLDEARRVLEGSPVHFAQAPAGALAPALLPVLGEQRIDRVLCNAALFQFPDYAGVLADLGQLLAPGGTLAFTVPEPTQGKAIAEVLARHDLYPLRGAKTSGFRPSPRQGPPGRPAARRGPPPQPSFEQRVAATEAAGWTLVRSQVRAVSMAPEEHVRWLLLPMFRHPSWAQVPDEELRPRLIEALRSEGERYPVAWRAVVVAPG